MTRQDELDALFEADYSMDDIFDTIRRERAAEETSAPEAKEVTYNRKQADDSNGVDEEIKITKKRKPVAKLDDKRLLSEAGIPKLQKISKDRFKFKGKGREFSDVAKLLRYYQLWLDDLYPRAKFADGLTIIEKLGHSKRIQMQRKAWIDEGKPKEYLADDDDAEHGNHTSGSPRAGSEHGGDIVRERSASSTPSVAPDVVGDKANDTVAPNHAEKDKSSGNQDLNEPDEDELDALLAEELIENVPSKKAEKQSIPERPPIIQEPAFDDDEEAMRDMDELW